MPQEMTSKAFSLSKLPLLFKNKTHTQNISTASGIPPEVPNVCRSLPMFSPTQFLQKRGHFGHFRQDAFIPQLQFDPKMKQME